MTNFNSERPGEFELIANFFAPLAAQMPGAYGLTDDAATIRVPEGEELVVTADLLTAGVHFRAEDEPQFIGRKALRTNLSDLAAKGAKPFGYLLSLALPRRWTLSWVEAFAAGLHEDQSEFFVALAGGDTTATEGPLTIAITAFGSLPSGTMIRRNGAKPGDLVFVSGTVGDAGAGLAVLDGQRRVSSAADREALISRYLLPQPRIALGRMLRNRASAAIDISDGLLADLGHIAGTSRARFSILAERIPLSDAAKKTGLSVPEATSAGDDYEIAFTAPESLREDILRFAGSCGCAVTQIGVVEAGSGVALLDSFGREISVSKKGYRHF
jgi:thiamine-monophosphate kinase